MNYQHAMLGYANWQDSYGVGFAGKITKGFVVVLLVIVRHILKLPFRLDILGISHLFLWFIFICVVKAVPVLFSICPRVHAFTLTGTTIKFLVYSRLIFVNSQDKFIFSLFLKDIKPYKIFNILLFLHTTMKLRKYMTNTCKYHKAHPFPLLLQL